MGGKEVTEAVDHERLASLLADKLEERRSCRGLTQEEEEELKGLLRTKKGSVKVFLFLMGALALWILKDIYAWVAGHLAFK